MSIFELAREQITIERPVVLFLDALDEFNGYPETIADFLSSLGPGTGQQKTFDIKICFSSRPWDIFVERFDKCCGIKLQDLTRPDISRYADFRLQKILDPAPLDSISESTQSHLTRIVNYIHENAQEVFLWVTLVLDELTKLSHMSPQSLYAEMTKFPADLEDYYQFTLGRIPPKYKYDAFILLELVLRCEEGQVDLRDLYFAFICAKGATFEMCRQLLLVAYLKAQEESSMVTQLKDLCGGLLEVVQLEDKDHQGVKNVVQFIHETTKEFVHRPGLRQCLVCNSGLALVWVNGHHFWTKYWFASATSFSHDQRIGELLCTHSCFAEYTAGSHFGTFLDTVPDTFFNCQRSNCFECRRDLDLKIWIGSRLSFAAVSGLQLYISHKLADKAKECSDGPALLLNSDQTSPLAYMICTECNRRRNAIRPSLLDSSLVATLQMPIDHGLQLNTLVNGVSPLEHFFYGMPTSFWDIKHENHYRLLDRADVLPTILDILLSAGCSPETALTHGTESLKTESSRCACRPLHATHDAKLIRVLLEHRADPDALDEEGQTPLDTWVVRFDCLEARRGWPDDWINSLEIASLLIAAGGHLTQDEKRDFRRRRMRWLRNPIPFSRERVAKFRALMETAPVLQTRLTRQELKLLKATYRKSMPLSTYADLDSSCDESSKPKSWSLEDRFRRFKS
jgi:hypothetical protein